MNKNLILANKLIDWFYQNARTMPWRTIGGAHKNAYEVWISEIMLQQTTVKTVESYFPKWMQRFKDVETLANADIEDVLLCWQGLGYYTRARKIHECAKVLIEKYGGELPKSREALLKLPGIGPYSASSIMSFAFNMPETVVDGNVIRVVARLYGIETPVTKEEIFKLATPLTHMEKPADYASAIMDLGATVCMAQNPKCLLCPWREDCIAFQKKLTDKIPLIKKPEKKQVEGFVYLIKNDKGEYFIQKRQEKGLLHGLYEFLWTRELTPLFDDMGESKNETVSHTFTHFHLTLHVIHLNKNKAPNKEGIFVHPKNFGKYPFSTLMKKIIKLLPD